MALETAGKADRAQAGGQQQVLELETAKEILAEILQARPSNVDEMIQMRLEEKNWSKESWQEEEPWPRKFCLDE